MEVIEVDQLEEKQAGAELGHPNDFNGDAA